jgi:hypothetical protein
MAALICQPPTSGLSGRSLAIGIMLASAIVIARDGEGLDAPPALDYSMSEEIYEQAEGWRGSGGSGDNWRAPEIQPRARIHFGFDSAFEEKQMRSVSYQETRRSNLREPTANTQFRIDFLPRNAR